MRNLLFSATLAVASLFSFNAYAAEAPYEEISPKVQVSDPDKIEVVELFWYGCPHCYAFEPTINPWVKKLPADVKFVRIPAMFGGAWDVHGRLFLTLDSMGVEDKVHQAIFEQLHNAPNSLKTREEMAEFLKPHGVDADKFSSTYESFAVSGRVEQAKRLAIAYQIKGVPMLIINGKYRFGIVDGPENTLKLADQLIDKERQASQ